MKWFKHDSDAHADAKIRKLMIKYGARGYGLYWYCLECIAKDIDDNNLTFELEHDSEILAHDLSMDSSVVEEMMLYMVKLGLFENASGKITCLKMLKRLDQSMTGNIQMRKLITTAKKNHDAIMTPSCSDHDAVMPEEIRLEETRREESNNTSGLNAHPRTPYSEIISAYHDICIGLPRVARVNPQRKTRMKNLHREVMEANVEEWQSYFTAVSNTPFLNGKNDRNWVANFDFLLTDKSVNGVLEGKYRGQI